MRFALLLSLLFLTNCQTLHFYSQGVRGQFEIIRKSRPNEEVIAAPDSSEELKKKLMLADEICRFASDELILPGDSAYQKYADLGRNHVVFVLHAAPEFSMEPKTWFYPIVGEMEYRGYFAEADAKAYEKSLKAEGLDVHVGGTDAYSTLGFFHDPLLNTFISYPEIDLAETILHELTHRKVFVSGDTEFNECLANAVAEEGIRRWLISKNRSADLADYEERLQRRRDFYKQVDIAKDQLVELYASGIPEEDMRQRKQVVLENLKDRARDLQRRWGGKPLEGWLRLDLTNAHLNAIVAYNEQIPMFKKLLEESDGDFDLFFEKVEKLK